MGRKGVAIFLFISLALSVIPAVQNNYTETIFATAQTELSTEQKRSINQTALRIVNINLGFVGNTTIPSAAATTMVTALGQVIERLIVQTSNSDQIITHIAIETAANPTGPLSQALLLFAKQLAAGDTSGVNQLGSLIAQLTEPSIVNATTLANITGNISQLIMQQAFQSALGANLLLNQIANKLAANSSKLSVNNVTISGDAIAQIIQNIIIQVSLQQQVSFQPLLFIANQVNQNPLGPLSKSIVQLAQLQTTGGASASQSITQSLSELVKQILSSAEGTITKSLGIISSTEPTSEDQSKDTRTKIIIRDKFDERKPPKFQSPPEQPPQRFQDNQSLIVPITNESTLLPPPTPMNATSPEDEILPQTPTPIDTNQTVQLTVIKEVINDNDGTRAAEDLDINLVDSRGESVYPLSPIAPAENERVFDLAVGRYYLQAGGFEYLAIFEGDCDSAGKVTIVGDGINRSCTVKFDDRIIGAVKFVTNVINDNGGNKTARDFQFDLIRAGGLLVTIRGAPPPDGETWTTPSDYTIIPHTVPDYTTTLEGDCTDVLVVENLTKNCTIVNDDLPAAGGELLSPPPSTPITGNQTNATLILNIRVINDDGVSIQPQDLGATVDVFDNNFVVAQILASNGSRNTFSVQPGNYTINFSPGHWIAYFLGNYSFGNTCRGPQVLGAGDTKTCFTTFNDIGQPTNGSQTSSTGSLSVKTHIINNNTNSMPDASDVFMLLKIGHIQQLFKGSEEGITFTLPANTEYFVTVAEPQMAHLISHSDNCGGPVVRLLGGNTTILPGEIKTCTITLDDRGNNIQILSVGNRTLQNITSFSTATSQNETICDDGIDNDNDVKIDAADKDCLLTTSATTPDENATTTSLIPTTDPEQGPTQTQEQEQAEENNPPTADAGDDFSTESGKTVKLNGEASSDPDDRQTLSYLWEQVSPDSPSVSLNSEKEELASFKAPSVDEDTKFRFELTVIDGKGGEDTDSVTVVVLGSPDNEEQKENVEQQAENSKQEQEQEQQETKTSKTNKIPSDSLSEIPKG